MKKILLLSSVVALLSGCAGTGNGELTGDPDRLVWNPTDPYGMVFIPQGSFIMGPSDQDVPFANVSTNQRVSVGAFYMDETEITNNEYRQFENWVVDSIIRSKLKMFKTRRVDGERDTLRDGNGNYKIDWTLRFDKEKYDFLYDSIFVRDYVDGKPIKNTKNFVYKYEELDIRSLSKSNSSNIRFDDFDSLDFRDNFVVENLVQIYPSTLDYQSDYAYANNETDAEFNYEHEAHDDYPVVGITWEQATAFCHWRTHIMNDYLRSNKQPLLPDFRLPTETEWEYAARGGLGLSPYPWGGPYTRNMKGCFLLILSPLRGNLTADGGLKAIKVRQYNPNNFGLYDMSGNVAEWTSTVFDETSSNYSHDMNPDNSYISEESDQDVLKRKVVRGGSWKDISYFIQTSTRTYEYDDVSTSYIGFRCVVDFLGRDKKDFQ